MSSVSQRLVHFLRSVYWYWRFPGECYGCYRGIFDSAEAAIAASPKHRSLGYDNTALAEEYQSNMDRAIGSYDYPMLFWLKDLLPQNHRIFDVGGNVGTQYYGYERYLHYPEDLRWTVCEVPAIVEAGRKLAAQENARALSFTTQFTDAEGTDILMASGSLQYIQNFEQQLTDLQQKPRYLLLDRLPLCDGSSFVTLQNGGMVFYPVYIRNRETLIEKLTHLGYQVLDIWQDKSEPCVVPFHPEMKTLSFWGLLLQRR
jgi:putative methyltransferase (TIGR04325 family)